MPTPSAMDPQETHDDNLNVGIFIPTMNKADFVIRQLRYYAALHSPHPVYIGDSSAQEEKEKLEHAVQQFQNTPAVRYRHFPKEEYSQARCEKELIGMVNEKYVIFSGDDDYLVPSSLTRCAAFLESHPDYATAHGKAITFKLDRTGPYGNLKKISDYPQPSVEDESAAGRLFAYLNNYFVPMFSVNRTRQMQKDWDLVDRVKEHTFAGEVLPCTLSVLAGKSKTLNCLGFVRQMHDMRQIAPDTFDWITKPEWHEAFKIYESALIEKVINLDRIQMEEARARVKRACMAYLIKYMQLDLQSLNANLTVRKAHKPHASFRSRLTRLLPFLKQVYRAYRRAWYHEELMHREVMSPGSPYFADFSEIRKSFSSSSAMHV